MRVNIISNLANGYGLQQTYELLREELERRGHVVQGVQFNRSAGIQRAAVNLFVETVRPELFPFANEQWVIPMPEWWDVRWFNLPFDRVLALTHDCHHRFQARFGHRCTYLGWRTRDLYDPTVPRHRGFLHVGGKSPYKNTEAAIDGCRLAGVPLTVIGAQRRVTRDEIVRAMNTHMFHLMPSAYEGYGYALHEAESARQIVVTTDAPPMNELGTPFLVPSVASIPCHAAMLYAVAATDIAAVVTRLLHLSAAEWAEQQARSRARWEAANLAFQHACTAIFGPVVQ